MSRKFDLHSWDVDPRQARELQQTLAARLDATRPLPPVKIVGGADVSYNLRGKWLYATVIVVRAGTDEVIERVGVVAEARFPYVPSLLSFREAPAVIAAFDKLTFRPDVLICDGQGIAHPSPSGTCEPSGIVASHPHDRLRQVVLFGRLRGARAIAWRLDPFTDSGVTIGGVLRTRARVKPLFISPGHLCDLAGAIAVILANVPKYRLPITTRIAHQYVNNLRRAGQ